MTQTARTPAPSSASAPAGRRALLAWLVADAMALTGTRLAAVALPWLALTTTGSPTAAGLVAFAELTPLVVAKVLSGPLIDRLGARRVAVACDAASVLPVLAIPALHHLDALALPTLLALVAVVGLLRGPADAARDSLVPALAEATGQPLERITGLSSTIERTSSLVGAAVAAGLVALVGAADALVVNAAGFALAALVLGVGLRTVGHGSTDTDDVSYLLRLRAGWRFLRGEPVVLALTVMIACTNLLDVAFTAVLLPVWAVETGAGVGAVGLLLAVMSGTSVVGSLVAAAWAARMPRFTVYVVAFLVCGLPRFLVLAWSQDLTLPVVVMAVAGLASGFLNPVVGAVFFERIPTPLVGRVSAMSTAVAWALMPLGGLVGSGLLAVLDVGAALTSAGVLYLVITLAPLVDRRFRAMGRPAGEVS
ncbi:MFS family permease [Aeromicrobium sp. SORGH_AS981]|uniref:MFS transporter n=1 Tax=Aeromicrobium sp. SORGH_AS_0981 TaxID=3041802 RepID=UPI0028576187|nr:MFS transporter [Aeromicrobium sp. SORGH_AS_0981]MDR6119543.1 MFS family permease [Aeromicrobium sp. SORGH_AS_0981]